MSNKQEITEKLKTLLGEDKLGIEPVINQSARPVGYQMFFEEGEDTISDSDKTMAAEHSSRDIMNSLPTIEEFILVNTLNSLAYLNKSLNFTCHGQWLFALSVDYNSRDIFI